LDDVAIQDDISQEDRQKVAEETVPLTSKENEEEAQ
jgi:hypothetical protein